MKYKFYLSLLILPLLISFNSPNQAILEQGAIPASKLKTISFDLVKRWKVDAPAFFDENIDNYTLSPTIDIFGYFIEFKEDKTFVAYYAAFCGNDCFTTTKGTYNIKEDHVEIFVSSTQQTGFCSNPISFKNKKMGTFKIIKKKKDNFLLKRL